MAIRESAEHTPVGREEDIRSCQDRQDPVDLSLGEPDFDIPDPIKEEGIKWIRKGFNKYTPSGGIPELREKVLLYLRGKGISAKT